LKDLLTTLEKIIFFPKAGEAKPVHRNIKTVAGA
jgi:hypothetical protein